MAHPASSYVSPEEYLRQERASLSGKSEYFNGEIFAMSGVSRSHDRITGAIFSALDGFLRDTPCEPFTSDMRVKSAETGLYTYPDVTVACEDARFEDAEVDTLLDPVVIFEVLSPSTERYDRGKKFEHYQAIPSLREYVLVAQDAVRVEHYARQEGGQWLLTNLTRLEDTLELTSVACALPLREIYRRVSFPTNAG